MPESGGAGDATERFPARRSLFRSSAEESGPSLQPDAVLEATRRLLRGRMTTRTPGTSAASLEEHQLLLRRLGLIERNLRGLKDRLASHPEDPPQPSGLEPGLAPDDVARELVSLARGYFDECRLLSSEASTPADELEDFAGSTYLDLLERRFPRLLMVVDAEGRLLRLAHADRAPAGAAPPPALGCRLQPRPEGPLAELGEAWPGLPPLSCLGLGGGLLLVLEESAPRDADDGDA